MTTALVLIGALALLGVAMGAFLVYKLRQVNRTVIGMEGRLAGLSANVTRNMQLLAALEHELALERPLPPLRAWAASPDVLLLLAEHVRRSRPSTIVELGSGASTVVLARAAALAGDGGRVHAFEHDAAFAEQTRELLARYGLAGVAQVHDAPLQPLASADGTRRRWYAASAFDAIDRIDLLFVDGPPGDVPDPLARAPAATVLFPRLASGASVFLDDAERPGEQAVVQSWREQYPRFRLTHHACEKGCTQLTLDGG